MIIAHAQGVVPRKMLICVFSIALFSVFATFFSQWTGIGQQPEKPLSIVTERSLLFLDHVTGGILVRDAKTGDDVHLFEPGQSGFVRTALRAMAFSRQKFDIGPEMPFRLVATTDRCLLLIDPLTEHQVELNAFGRGNAQQFDVLLPQATVNTADAQTIPEGASS
ncbi:MAG: photosynthetic complex assembly protein PuhC [Pseudomonadota bacterium]